MVQRLGHYDGMSKNDAMWIWRTMERVKWTDKMITAVVLERVGEGTTMLELVKKRKRNWLGDWLKRNSLLNDALERMVNVTFAAEDDIR